jgi:hypothetical protein
MEETDDPTHVLDAMGGIGFDRILGFETMPGPEMIVLWRPVGPVELELIKQLKMRAFPPRLPDQPIFYPVLSEEYAVKIARDWNVPASGRGFVTRFRVRKEFLERYEVHEVGGRAHLEYWIPAAGGLFR